MGFAAIGATFLLCDRSRNYKQAAVVSLAYFADPFPPSPLLLDGTHHTIQGLRRTSRAWYGSIHSN